MFARQVGIRQERTRPEAEGAERIQQRPGSAAITGRKHLRRLASMYFRAAAFSEIFQQRLNGIFIISLDATCFKHHPQAHTEGWLRISDDRRT